jgi:hypothetical protein
MLSHTICSRLFSTCHYRMSLMIVSMPRRKAQDALPVNSTSAQRIPVSNC